MEIHCWQEQLPWLSVVSLTFTDLHRLPNQIIFFGDKCPIPHFTHIAYCLNLVMPCVITKHLNPSIVSQDFLNMEFECQNY